MNGLSSMITTKMQNETLITIIDQRKLQRYWHMWPLSWPNTNNCIDSQFSCKWKRNTYTNNILPISKNLSAKQKKLHYVPWMHTNHTNHAVLDLFHVVATIHHLNYGGQESKKTKHQQQVNIIKTSMNW